MPSKSGRFGERGDETAIDAILDGMAAELWEQAFLASIGGRMPPRADYPDMPFAAEMAADDLFAAYEDAGAPPMALFATRASDPNARELLQYGRALAKQALHGGGSTRPVTGKITFDPIGDELSWEFRSSEKRNPTDPRDLKKLNRLSRAELTALGDRERRAAPHPGHLASALAKLGTGGARQRTTRRNPPRTVTYGERTRDTVAAALRHASPRFAQALQRRPDAVRAGDDPSTIATGWLDHVETSQLQWKAIVFTEGGIGDPGTNEEVWKGFDKAAEILRKDPWYEDAGWESINPAVQMFWVKPRRIATSNPGGCNGCGIWEEVGLEDASQKEKADFWREQLLNEIENEPSARVNTGMLAVIMSDIAEVLPEDATLDESLYELHGQVENASAAQIVGYAEAYYASLP